MPHQHTNVNTHTQVFVSTNFMYVKCLVNGCKNTHANTQVFVSTNYKDVKMPGQRLYIEENMRKSAKLTELILLLATNG